MESLVAILNHFTKITQSKTKIKQLNISCANMSYNVRGKLCNVP